MMNTGIENDIGYRLVKASDSKRDSYRAVLKHDALSARATLDEICSATPLPRHLIESAVGGTLDTMIRRTLGDGRTRRFGNWFETRCDILGRFDRIDEAFDPARHKVAVNLLPLAEFDQYGRKNPPINERQRPRGRIDYVTWPGGDKGEVKVGENILVVGHDLELAPHDTLELGMNVEGRRLTYVTHLYVHEDEEEMILEHDDEHILVKWFGERNRDRISSPDAMFFFCPWTRDNRPYSNAPMRGSSAHVKVIS